MTRKPKWTPEENAACIALYFRMRKHVDDGANYNKAAMIRAARGENPNPLDNLHGAPLANRTRQSIEAKLMNVTACLHDLERSDVSMTAHGYRPLSNYQADLRPMVAGLLAVRDEAVNGGFNPGALSA